MNRRKMLQLSTLGLAGCGHLKSQYTTLQAGPFAVEVPRQWAHNVIIEKVPFRPLYTTEEWKRHEQHKPGYICCPQHWALRLPSALPAGVRFDRTNAGDDSTAPQILIHKAREWAVAFTDGVHEQALYSARHLRQSMDRELVQDAPYPSPGYMDATLDFRCLKRRIDFTGGHGVRLVAQWTVEADFVTLGELHYLFLGMSDDDSCQIIATFPLSLPGLPKRGDKSHLGYSLANYMDFTMASNRYKSAAKHWLTEHSQEFTPSLNALDAMMQSLVAPHWL